MKPGYKTFPLIHLAPIADPEMRLTCEVADLGDVLKHLFGVSIGIHELPSAIKYARSCMPLWFGVIEQDVRTLYMRAEVRYHPTLLDLLLRRKKRKVFELYMQLLKGTPITFDVPELSHNKREGWLQLREKIKL